MLRGIGVLKIDPLLALDIDVEIFVLVLAVASVFDEMDVHGPVVQRAFNLFACKSDRRSTSC